MLATKHLRPLLAAGISTGIQTTVAAGGEWVLDWMPVVEADGRVVLERASEALDTLLYTIPGYTVPARRIPA